MAIEVEDGAKNESIAGSLPSVLEEDEVRFDFCFDRLLFYSEEVFRLRFSFSFKIFPYLQMLPLGFPFSAHLCNNIFFFWANKDYWVDKERQSFPLSSRFLGGVLGFSFSLSTSNL